MITGYILSIIGVVLVVSGGIHVRNHQIEEAPYEPRHARMR